MLYLVIALSAFVLFMLRPFFGYYEYRHKYEEIQKELQCERERFSKEKKTYAEQLNNARNAKQVIEKESAAKEEKMREKISSLGSDLFKAEREIAFLKYGYVPDSPFNCIGKPENKTAPKIEPAHRHAPIRSPEEQRRLREKTWGDLFRVYRHVYGTLTPDQEKLVKYPELDPCEVFFAPNSKSFHAVDWCYTIESSAEIGFCSLDEAKSRKLKPCSKCVSPVYR